MTGLRISYLWLLILGSLLAFAAYQRGEIAALQHQLAKAKAQGPTWICHGAYPPSTGYTICTAEEVQRERDEAEKRADHMAGQYVNTLLDFIAYKQAQPKPAPRPLSCGETMRLNPQSWCSDDSRDFRGQPLVRNWRFGKLQGSHPRRRR